METTTTWHCHVKGTSYFVDVQAKTKREAMKKAPEVFRDKINTRYIPE
jgi:hypothetical protein